MTRGWDGLPTDWMGEASVGTADRRRTGTGQRKKRVARASRRPMGSKRRQRNGEDSPWWWWWWWCRSRLCVITLQRRLGHKEPWTFWCDPERDTQRIYVAGSNRGEPWSHAAGTRPWRGDARWTESLECQGYEPTNMAAAARVAITGMECSVIIHGAHSKTRLRLFLRQEYPSTPFRLVADGLDRLLEGELGRLPCALPDTEGHLFTLLGIVLQMVALELDELIKAVLAQRDALSRVLPPCPGQILPIVSACKL